MKRMTTEDRIREWVQANPYASQKKKIEYSDEMAEEICKTNDALLSISKRFVWYGTWKLTLYANECHFGNELAKRLERLYRITHDEESKGDIQSFKEQISDIIYWLIEKIEDETEEEGGEQ